MNSDLSTTSVIFRKALSGLLSMGLRQVFGMIVNILGGILLARILTPDDFGLYALLIFALNFLITFGDIGLGASLIRQKEAPSELEYRAIFTIQQILVILVSLITWIASPWIIQLYNLPVQRVWLFRLTTISLVFTSLQVIPSIRMERNLEFNKLAWIEMTQGVVYNIIAVVTAQLGLGALCFALGLIARSVIGAILTYLIKPWRIGWHWDWNLIKEHLTFGLPYQGVNILNMLSASINPIVIGLIFGLTSAGLIAWSTNLLERLYHPLYIINRLLFPTYSRLENDSSALAKAVNYTYAATGFVHFGLASILAGAGPIFITVLFTDKWMPALPLIYLLLLGSIFYPMTIPNTALAYSLGWSKTVLMINLIKTVIFWVSVLVFIRVTNSFLSYAYANLISESVQMVLYLILHSKFRVINVLSGQLPSFLSGIIVTVILAVLGNFPWQQNQLYQLVVAVLLGGSLYTALTFAFSWIGIQFRMDSVFINALIAMKRTVFIRKING